MCLYLQSFFKNQTVTIFLLNIKCIIFTFTIEYGWNPSLKMWFCQTPKIRPLISFLYKIVSDTRFLKFIRFEHFSFFWLILIYHLFILINFNRIYLYIEKWSCCFLSMIVYRPMYYIRCWKTVGVIKPIWYVSLNHCKRL